MVAARVGELPAAPSTAPPTSPRPLPAARRAQAGHRSPAGPSADESATPGAARSPTAKSPARRAPAEEGEPPATAVPEDVEDGSGWCQGARSLSPAHASPSPARWAPRPPWFTLRRGHDGGGDAQVSRHQPAAPRAPPPRRLAASPRSPRLARLVPHSPRCPPISPLPARPPSVPGAGRAQRRRRRPRHRADGRRGRPRRQEPRAARRHAAARAA